jgi:cardiolipin synthase A/B
MQRYLRPVLTAAAGAALFCGCGSAVPDVDPMLSGPEAAAPKPILVDGRGPLIPSESKAILAKLQREGRDTDILQRHLAFEASFTDTPLTVGNKVTLLRDG